MSIDPAVFEISVPEKLPFLEPICWQIENVYRFTPDQMLSRYERGWSYRNLFSQLEGEELNFLKELVKYYNSWLQTDLSESMTFKLDHHKKILTILESFDADVLRESTTYFGDGTLLALDFGEYRLSKDVDFICPISTSGYKQLRTIIFNHGYQALLRDQNRVQVGRGNNNQYGIRMVINVDGEPIKTEIIAEARFELDPPRYPTWSPVACLSLSDCFTAKLLANSDQFMDDSVEARDLIDLAVLRLQSPIRPEAIRKAENAYEVMRPLESAIQRFQQRETHRERCFSGLQIDTSQVPKIIDGIDLLSIDLGLAITERIFKEKHDDLY